MEHSNSTFFLILPTQGEFLGSMVVKSMAESSSPFLTLVGCCKARYELTLDVVF